MSVIIRLQNLAWSASSRDVRLFFKGLKIPDGGVHIVGGDEGDAFIAFASDEDARKAMTMSGKEIHNKPISLLLSSKVEMSRVISDARDRLASASPTPSPQPPAFDGSPHDASSGAGESGFDETAPPHLEGTGRETTGLTDSLPEPPMQNLFTNFRLGKRSPAHEPPETLSCKSMKRGPREYNTASWAARSSEFTEEQNSTMNTLPDVAANSNPTPSNDTFIMAKAEEALKALQMMGVIPSFYTQDSTEVTASLSKDSRMSTIANEDPRESASRLVPKSLAICNVSESSSSMSISQDSRTPDFNRGDSFGDKWPNVTPSISRDHGEEDAGPTTNSFSDRYSEHAYPRGDEDDPSRVNASPPKSSLWNAQRPDGDSTRSRPQPDWSRPPPSREGDKWNDVEDEDADAGQDADLPYGMHHFSAGGGARDRRGHLPASHTRNPYAPLYQSQRSDVSQTANQIPPSTIPAAPFVREADNHQYSRDFGGGNGGAIGRSSVVDGEKGSEGRRGFEEGRDESGLGHGLAFGGNGPGFGGNGPGFGGGGAGDDNRNFGDGRSAGAGNFDRRSFERSIGGGEGGVAANHSGMRFNRDARRIDDDGYLEKSNKIIENAQRTFRGGGGDGDDVDGRTRHRFDVADAGNRDDRRRTASGPDLNPQQKTHFFSDAALPIGALFPPKKSNPFDVLFEKPFRPSALRVASPPKVPLPSSSIIGGEFESSSTPRRAATSPTSNDAIEKRPMPLEENVVVAENDKVDVCRRQFFVALVNMDWNINFQGVSEFIRPAREGPRGVYPCYGVIGKLNGNFVVQLDTEEDLNVVLKKDGATWANRRVVTFRILEKQFDEIETAFKNRVPYVKIEKPPARFFERPQRAVNLGRQKAGYADSSPDEVAPLKSVAPLAAGHHQPNPPQTPLASQLQQQRPNLTTDKDMRLDDSTTNSKMIYERRKSESKTGLTVFEYNNGEAGDSAAANAPGTAYRQRQNSDPFQSKLFETRTYAEKFSPEASDHSSHPIGDTDARVPSSAALRPNVSNTPFLGGQSGVSSSPLDLGAIRWIGAVKNPSADVGRKDVRQILGDVRTVEEGIRVLHPRKLFPDELIFVEFVDRDSLYEGMDLLRHSRIVYDNTTAIFRVTERQYADCVAAHERGSRFVVEPPSAPVPQHFFVHVLNAPKDAQGADLRSFLFPADAREIHRLWTASSAPFTNFVVEVVGKSDLDAVVAMDGKCIDERHRVDIFRIVRYQYEDAVASIEKRTLAQLKPPSNREVESDDNWYAEYLRGYDRELRTFAYDFKRKRKVGGGDGAIIGGGNRGGSRRTKSPSRDRRLSGRDRSASKGKDGSRPRSPLGRNSPRNRSPAASSGRRDGEAEGGRSWRDQNRKDVDGRCGERAGSSGRSRDASRDRDRKTDDDRVAARKGGGNAVVVVEDPKKPVQPGGSGKYGLQIGGLDSRVPQSRMNAFFAEMGVKTNNVRIVFRPGTPTAVAFVETSDYAVYLKAFDFQGRLLDGKFPICVENVASDSINKRFEDIRKGRWFPKMSSPPNSSSATPREHVCVPGQVRPLIDSNVGTLSELGKPVAVVTPENRVVATPADETATAVSNATSTPASLTVTAILSSGEETSNQSSSVEPSNQSSSLEPSNLSSSEEQTNQSSSEEQTNQFDALSFIERNLASASASSLRNGCRELDPPPRIRVDSAPVDVTAKDVEEFFGKERQLRCERIDIRRHVEETASGLIGKVSVVVTFPRHEDCEDALKITHQLKGVNVILRREEGFSVSNANVAATSAASSLESTATSGENAS